MLRNIVKKIQRSGPRQGDIGQQQPHDEEPKSLYDVAREILINADIDTIFDFDTFCEEVLYNAGLEKHQRPSFYMHLGSQRSRFFEDARDAYVRQSFGEDLPQDVLSTQIASSRCQPCAPYGQTFVTNCPASAASHEDLRRDNEKSLYEASSIDSVGQHSSRSCQVCVPSLRYPLTLKNTYQESYQIMQSKQKDSLKQEHSISKPLTTIMIQDSPCSVDLNESNRVKVSQRQVTEERAAVQLITMPPNTSAFPPQENRSSRRNLDEESKHSRSSSPSLSLSSLEDEPSDFNITHIYKMARKHQMDTTALLHELKPGSTRRESKILEKNSPKIQNKEQSLGYGELTIGSAQKMIHVINNSLFQDLRYPGPELFDPSLYMLRKDSTFFDIGHGTGKVVMHVALAVGCRSKGIEINKVRFDLSKRLKKLLIDKHSPKGWDELIDLHHKDATSLLKFQIGREDASHIFCFDKVFCDDLLASIVESLNRTRFKVFISSQTPQKLQRLGLQRCLCAAQFKGRIGGSVFEMYVYLKEYQSSPHSSKPNSPQIQQTTAARNSIDNIASPRGNVKCKIETIQAAIHQSEGEVASTQKSSSVKKEVYHWVKEELMQTPGKLENNTLIGKRLADTPNFEQLNILHAGKRACQGRATVDSTLLPHIQVVKRIKQTIEDYRGQKQKWINEIYENLEPLQKDDNYWKSLSPSFRECIENNIKGIRHYTSDPVDTYLCKGSKSKLEGQYFLFKPYSSVAIDRKRGIFEKIAMLKSKFNPQMKMFLLHEQETLLIDQQGRNGALLRLLNVGDLEELLESTSIHVPLLLLKHHFRVITHMLHEMHLAGFCHWNIYNSSVKLNYKLHPYVRNNDKLHQINSFLPGGLRCHYQLPPLYTADRKVDRISPDNKKAIDLYMLGVVIYRALLGVPYPYAKQTVDKGIQRYKFSSLDISFPQERLELMGWTLDEIQGSKTLLEGLLQLDPAQQMNTQQVLSHPWLEKDPLMRELLNRMWDTI